jgi:hypothetical protein
MAAHIEERMLLKKRRKGGPAPKRKSGIGIWTLGVVGAIGAIGPPWLGGLGPPQKHKTKTKRGLTTGNGNS